MTCKCQNVTTFRLTNKKKIQNNKSKKKKYYNNEIADSQNNCAQIVCRNI